MLENLRKLFDHFQSYLDLNSISLLAIRVVLVSTPIPSDCSGLASSRIALFHILKLSLYF